MKSLRNAKLRGRRVLMRVDFNVYPVKPHEPRIEKILPTIRYLLARGARVTLATHLEMNDGRIPSVGPLVRYLKKRRFPTGEIIFLENLRKNPGEKKNNMAFAKKLAKLGDVYVNEAFSVSHRRHASLVLLPELLPAYCGFLFESEVKNLSRAFHPPHPFTLILAGGKVETKLPLLKALLAKTDHVLLGGIIANVFLKKPLVKSKKIILPEDLVIKNGRALDVGPKTIKNWAPIIKKSKLIVWNGPLGFMEKGYTAGTKRLVSILKKSKAKVIIGGGDTTDYLPRNLPKNIFVSTGGGAMLEFLAKGTLPGIEALKK
ncbi:MAG: phosphoglycerate kinase [bacterium]|nr:phosphoglycerate kinase [bacterium]